MMSQIPLKVEKGADAQIARAGMIAELDAINLYEQMADASDSPDLKKLLLDISDEEKVHAGEFLELLTVKTHDREIAFINKGISEAREKLKEIK